MSNYKMPCEECYPPHPEPHDRPKKEVELVCGTGSGVSLPIRDGDHDKGLRHPLVIATVNIDTSKWKDITKKIEFSSIVNFKTEEFERDFSIILVFQLSAACNGGAKVPLGTWTYERSVEIDSNHRLVADHGGGGSRLEQIWEFSDPFCFTWCECEECPECCRFIVEIVELKTDSIACASVNNVSISALATGFPRY